MSFPRAKLIRFNDMPTCTPSPADYLISIKEKPKLAIIPQSERFSEVQSPTKSEISSTHSTPCFRTPTMLKKKKPGLNFGSKSASKALFKKPNSDYELLNEKIVECKNKDVFIIELTEQLEDLKNKISELENQKSSLDTDKQKFDELSHEIVNKHQRLVSELNQMHEKEIIEIRTEMKIAGDELDKIRKEHEDLKSNNIEKLQIILTKFDDVQDLYKNSINEHNLEIEEKCKVIEKKEMDLINLEDQYLELQSRHAAEIDTLQKNHNNEKRDIEYEMLVNISEIQKTLEDEKRTAKLKIKEVKKSLESEIAFLKQTSHTEKELILKENAAKIKQMEENFEEMKLLSEIQMREKCIEIDCNWKLKLEKQEKESTEILKECQAISEYNIIQCELEKNKMKTQLTDKTNDYIELEKKYDDVYTSYRQLQSNYMNIQKKLYTMIKELNLKENNKEYIEHLLNEKRAYEITIAQSQKTIEVLKNRLIDSDQDVEQLKSEISHCEEKILDYEFKCIQLTNELQETQVNNEELESQNECNVKSTETEVKKIKTELIQQIDNYKLITENKLKETIDKLENKTKEFNLTLNLLHDQQRLNQEASRIINKSDRMLENIESENTEYKCHIKDLESTNLILKQNMEILTTEKKEWEMIRYELETKIHEISTTCEELRINEKDVVNSLNSQIIEIKANYNFCEENCHLYRNKLSEAEEELSNLREKNHTLSQENSKQSKLILEQKALIEPFKEQLEAYELEKNSLMSEKSFIENEAKELALKYVTILGHQNQKQKIKYMVNLKERNDDLIKQKLELEAKVRSQNKKIENLKKETNDLKRTLRKSKPFEDKENISSPNCSLNTSKFDSPCPLRERN